jgi:hypothetical protein
LQISSASSERGFFPRRPEEGDGRCRSLNNRLECGIRLRKVFYLPSKLKTEKCRERNCSNIARHTKSRPRKCMQERRELRCGSDPHNVRSPSSLFSDVHRAAPFALRILQKSFFFKLCVFQQVGQKLQNSFHVLLASLFFFHCFLVPRGAFPFCRQHKF